MRKPGRRYLFFTVFVAGMTTLAVELTASRMLQTVFGTSNVVWANVIGLVLLFLTVGYFLGGRLADSRPRPRVFYALVAFAGFSSVAFLLLTSMTLKTGASALATYDVGAVVSSFVGAVGALSVPITLLGCISPFAIRLGVDDVSEAGRVSGRVYAISTLGSLLGTYLPVLWVIPSVGSRVTAVVFGSSLLAVGLFGAWRQGASAPRLFVLPCFLLPFLFFGISGPIKASHGQIFETESPYNYVEVRRYGSCNLLFLNEGSVMHSIHCDGDAINDHGVYTAVLAAPFFNEPARVNSGERPIESAAIIGLGAGVVPKRLKQAFGPMPIDGIELDPAVVEAGREYFEMNDPNLNVIVGDGRYELNRLQSRYDLIVLDAYKPPYIPWHLTTIEFFEEIRERLTDRGVVAINVFRLPGDRRLLGALTETLQRVFPSVHTVDAGEMNSVLFATVLTTDRSNLFANQRRRDSARDPLATRALRMASAEVTANTSSEIYFTDEVAPLETLIDSMVLRFVWNEAAPAPSR